MYTNLNTKHLLQCLSNETKKNVLAKEIGGQSFKLFTTQI